MSKMHEMSATFDYKTDPESSTRGTNSSLQSLSCTNTENQKVITATWIVNFSIQNGNSMESPNQMKLKLK